MTADDALREEIARALYESRVVMGEPNTAWDRLQAAFRADWLYLASAILPIVARVEREAYQRGQAEHGPRASAPAASTETPDLGAWPTIPTERRTEVIEMTDTTERLAEIEARVEAATEGPWEATPTSDWDGVPQCAVVNDTGRITWDDHGGEVFHPHDAEFIAHARTDVPWLVEQVRELQAENESLRTALRRKENHRARAREQVRQRDEVIERLEGRIRELPADALRKAADALSQVDIESALSRVEELRPYLNPTARALVPMVQFAIRDWLRENADDIERGAQS